MHALCKSSCTEAVSSMLTGRAAAAAPGVEIEERDLLEAEQSLKVHLFLESGLCMAPIEQEASFACHGCDLWRHTVVRLQGELLHQAQHTYQPAYSPYFCENASWISPCILGVRDLPRRSGLQRCAICGNGTAMGAAPVLAIRACTSTGSFLSQGHQNLVLAGVEVPGGHIVWCQLDELHTLNPYTLP